MASSYQDLINALVNPYASEIMQAYGYVPSSGTPSITDPGTYTDPGGPGPGTYIPPSGSPGTVINPYATPGGTSPGGTSPGGTSPGGTSPGGTSPGGTSPGGTSPGGTSPGGGTPYEGPYNQSPEFLAMIEADIQNRFGGDRFLHSKRNIVSGDELGARQTYSVEEFASGILPYAKGKYGSGVTYDPKTGLMYNNITQEELARRRGEDGYARIFGVHPDALTARERELLKLGGHGEMTPGTQYIRIGGPTTGTHYFIQGDQVYAYDYKAGDTLGFGGMGPKYGEDNFQTTPVEFNQWIDDLKPSASESTSGADTAQAEQKEVGPSLASELVMQTEEMPQQLTVAAPSTRKEVPADANTMGQFAGSISFPSYSEMLQSNLDVFRNMTEEELMEMNRGRVPPPRISSAAPPVTPPVPSEEMAPPPFSGLMRREPPAGLRTTIEPTPTVPTTTVLPPPGTPRPDTGRLSFEDFRAPVPAPPPVSATIAPTPTVPTTTVLPPPGTPGPDTGRLSFEDFRAPVPATPAPKFTPEQLAAIDQALGAISSGGGFRLPFKNGGPVTLGIGELFKKEVMR